MPVPRACLAPLPRACLAPVPVPVPGTEAATGARLGSNEAESGQSSIAPRRRPPPLSQPLPRPLSQLRPRPLPQPCLMPLPPPMAWQWKPTRQGKLGLQGQLGFKWLRSDTGQRQTDGHADKHMLRKREQKQTSSMSKLNARPRLECCMPNQIVYALWISLHISWRRGRAKDG